MMSWLDTLEDIRNKNFSKASNTEREKAARDVINMCSYATAVVAVSPIPFSDALLMLPIQSGMVMTVGHIYGRKVTSAAAKDLLLELGATAGLGFLARQGIKALLPVFGALMTIPAAFAATWGIGRVAMAYFQNPNLSKEELNEIYSKAKREGSGMFSKESFDNFRKRNEDSINKVAEQQSAGEEEEEAEDAPPARKKKAPAAKKKAAPAKETPAKKAAASKSVSNELTATSIVEELVPRKIAERQDVAKKINGRVHLNISGNTGGKWTIDFTKAKNWVQTGHIGEPMVTVSCADDVFVEVATGKKSAATAVMFGSLSVEPLDLELAGAIGELFS